MATATRCCELHVLFSFIDGEKIVSAATSLGGYLCVLWLICWHILQASLLEQSARCTQRGMSASSFQTLVVNELPPAPQKERERMRGRHILQRAGNWTSRSAYALWSSPATIVPWLAVTSGIRLRVRGGRRLSFTVVMLPLWIILSTAPGIGCDHRPTPGQIPHSLSSTGLDDMRSSSVQRRPNPGSRLPAGRTRRSDRRQEHAAANGAANSPPAARGLGPVRSTGLGGSWRVPAEVWLDDSEDGRTGSVVAADEAMSQQASRSGGPRARSASVRACSPCRSGNVAAGVRRGRRGRSAGAASDKNVGGETGSVGDADTSPCTPIESLGPASLNHASNLSSRHASTISVRADADTSAKYGHKNRTEVDRQERAGRWVDVVKNGLGVGAHTAQAASQSEAAHNSGGVNSTVVVAAASAVSTAARDGAEVMSYLHAARHGAACLPESLVLGMQAEGGEESSYAETRQLNRGESAQRQSDMEEDSSPSPRGRSGRDALSHRGRDGHVQHAHHVQDGEQVERARHEEPDSKSEVCEEALPHHAHALHCVSTPTHTSLVSTTRSPQGEGVQKRGCPAGERGRQGTGATGGGDRGDTGDTQTSRRGRDMLRSPASVRSDAPSGFGGAAGFGGAGGLSPRSPLPPNWDESYAEGVSESRLFYM